MPKRIQRKRAKDWRMPEGAVYVGRPTKWGNPFEVGKDGDRDRCVELYAMLAGGYLCISKGPQHVDQQKKAHDAMGDAARELRGKDLACWCPLDKRCHADVLLAIANAPEGAK
jgi:hypothetical protein